MEWLVLWGVAQGAGVLVYPILENLAKEGAKDFVKDFFKDSLKKVLLREKDPRQVATGKAIKEFVEQMQQQLKFRWKLSDAETKSYIQEINKFIREKSVKEILSKAFDITCETLEAEKLKDTWNHLQLQPLPNNFNWEGVTEQYLMKCQQILSDDKELRAILDSQNLENIEKNTKEIAGIIAPFDLERYQEAIQETYGNLKLDSVDTDGAAYNRLKLWSIFIAQNVREVQQALPHMYELPKEHQKRLLENNQLEEIELDKLDSYKQVYIEQPITLVLDIINQKQTYKYTVILGDPGSGKSTLLQLLALNWARSPLSNIISQPIPLLIELRTYMRRREDKECHNFIDFFHKCSGAIHHLNQHQLHEQLKAGNALVMFDGLDEVFDSGQREDVITDIHRFTNDYHNVQVIVTSRIIGYKAKQLRDAGFYHFMLQDLDAEQITDFINRWHDLTFSDEVDKARKRERLQKAIKTFSAIRELAGNPLLLTMMAILNRNQELPRDRAELYNQASRVLLHQWDVERALIEDKRLDPKTIDYKDKQAILRQVAYFMQTSDKGLAGNLISADDLEKLITDYLKSIDFDKPREVARVMINQLRTRNFMLCFMGADYYAFVHRTFLEYFCASAFVWQFEKTRSLSIEELKTEVFGKHWHDESWHEVLRLIAGLIEVKFVGDIIEHLIAENGEAEKFNNLFLAAKCLTEVKNANIIASTANNLLNNIKNLTKYDLPYFYEDHDIEIVIVNEIRTKAVTAVATTWVEESQTKMWLKSCIQTDDDSSVRYVAVQELVRGWKDDPNTLPILKNRIQTDDDSSVRYVAVQELVRGWKDDPNTLPFLKNRIQTDDDSSVRHTAVQELIQGWKDDPNTLPFLKNCIQTDDDSSVRYVAVQELVRGWRDDPDTLPILKNRIQTDDDSSVRCVAVQELVRGWKDDPDTLPILKNRIQTDDNSNVRGAAVLELARGWKDDPNTLPFLKNRIQTDDNSDVRCVAVQELIQGWKDDYDTLPILKNFIQTDDNSDVRGAAVLELARGWRDDPDTLPILKNFIQTDDNSSVRHTAVQELIQGWKDDPNTLPFLKNFIQTDDNYYVRHTAVQELIQGWKDDPNTLPFLKNCIQTDDNYYVRHTAVQELIQGWKDDPNTLPFLKNCIQTDDDSSVRCVAVQELVRGWKDDPNTLPFLKNRIQTDDNSDVRGAALRELTRGWKDDPDTLPILKNRIQTDDNSDVRYVAVQELVRGWKDDPDTLPILKNRIQTDDNSDVRCVALRELTRGWKDEPGMFEFLFNVGINDPFKQEHDFKYNPRQIVLKIIIKQFSNHPKTLPLLHDRALNDPDDQVREFAAKKLKELDV
jgi:predicted NACHT family NTPase